MAEFALGLTKTAVEGTLSRVKSAMEEEERLRVRVEEDLVFITGEFQIMRSFLNASSLGERASKNQVVRTWVRQLRDLAFDVEDCVEFVIHLDKASPWDWIGRLSSSLICMARPPLPLDVAVAEIKRLKARVEDVSQRNTRYNLIGASGDEEDQNQHQLLMDPAVSRSKSMAAAAFGDLQDVWEARGKLCQITGGLERLINCEGAELKVISLWGNLQEDVTGELRWATIVKKAYDDAETCQEFKNRAWVKLPHPFNPEEFLNNLLTQFTSHHHRRHHDDISQLLLQVSHQKYLIVLDQELSSIADWDAIRVCLPDGNNGSRIIISTKHLGIAVACTGDPFQVSELQHFSHDRYLCAFFPKGCAHRTSAGEFIWQLRQPCVISLFVEHSKDKVAFVKEIWDDDELNNLRELDKINFEFARFLKKFEYVRWCPISERSDGLFNLGDFALRILLHFYRKDARTNELEEMVDVASEQDIVGWCRTFLVEHQCLLFIADMWLLEDWNLIKRHLLCESTRSYIVVVTDEPEVAAHCVDHEKYRVLKLGDMMSTGSDKQVWSGDAGGEGKIQSNWLIERAEMSSLKHQFPSVTVLSVWGIAGVGKSVIVRKNYNFCKTNSEDYRMYGWVDVPHPFDLTDLCRRLLLDLYSGDLEAKETAAIGTMEGQDPIHGCCKILRHNECYLVFDGLRSRHDWDLIKATLLSHSIGGRTIVITREEIIAIHCTGKKEHVLNVKGIEAEAAHDLFTGIALGGKQLSSPEQNILELTISKCGGLLEIVTAIGKACTHASSPHTGSLEYINANFMGILEAMPGLRSLFCWMQSYFDACSDELKPCIFYLSIFAADQSIRRSRLLRRWIAEGYSSAGGGTAEQKGEELLAELMKLSILYREQRTSTMSILYEGQLTPETSNCKVNGFFYEYIKSRPMEDNLVFTLEGSCSPSSRLAGQHLTISNSWDRDENVFSIIDLSRLRSLTVFGVWRSFLISDKMKMLRVLDLEGTSSALDGTTASVTDADLKQIGKLLPRLKFICLRGCKHITCLPDSFCAMRQLETLDVRHTSIVHLPPAIITKLHKLQYIRAGTTETRLISQEAVAPPSSPARMPPAAAATTTTQEDCHDGTSPFLRAEEASLEVVQEGSTSTVALKRRAGDLEESCSWWMSRNQVNLRRRRRLAANGGGVEVVPASAEGIGKMMHLHTLGVVNIAGGKGALPLLKELKKLTQLCKLGLSGINCKNWKDLCLAISGHLPHLESLSLQLLLLEEDGNYDFACFDDISRPPKTLKRLKVWETSHNG